MGEGLQEVAKSSIKRVLDPLLDGLDAFLALLRKGTDAVKEFVEKIFGKFRAGVDRAQEIPGYVTQRAKILSHADDVAAKIIKSTEKSIKGDSLEFGYIWNEGKGFRTPGPFTSNSKGHVRIPDAFGVGTKRLTKQQRKALKDSVFTHNHPNSSSLSSGDMQIFLKYGFREVRAVGKNGIVHSLKLKSGAKLGDKFRKETLKSLREARKRWTREFNLDSNELRDKYRLQNLEESYLLRQLDDYVEYFIYK